MCDVSGPITAGVIALNAIGAQDVHLVEEKIEKSIFSYSEIQHTDYTRFHRTTQIDNKDGKKYWPFGEIIKVTLSPQTMGDLLSNMYLVLELPPGLYSRNVGNSIFKSISFKVDGIEVEKIYDDWQVIYDELYLETSEKEANEYLINRMMYPVFWSTTERKKILNGYGALSTLQTIIPLRFFFSRKYSDSEYKINNPNRPYFPLCAIHKQKILLEIEFHNTWFFSKPVNSNAKAEPTFSLPTEFDFPTLTNFKLITEEITLSPEDRMYYMKGKYDMMTNLVFKNPSIESAVGNPVIKNNLVPSIPVKTIHWFLRRRKYEYEIPIPTPKNDTRFLKEYSDTYVSEGVNLIDSRFRFEKMKSAKIYLNSLDLPNVSLADHKYFKYYIPLQARLSSPKKNIYTYSFSMYPKIAGSSGTLDFSNFNSDKTFLELKMYDGTYSTDAYATTRVDRLAETYVLYIYYTGYKVFSFENGFMSEAR